MCWGTEKNVFHCEIGLSQRTMSQKSTITTDLKCLKNTFLHVTNEAHVKLSCYPSTSSPSLCLIPLFFYSISVHLWHLKVKGAGLELDLYVAAEATS